VDGRHCGGEDEADFLSRLVTERGTKTVDGASVSAMAVMVLSMASNLFSILFFLAILILLGTNVFARGFRVGIGLRDTGRDIGREK